MGLKEKNDILFSDAIRVYENVTMIFKNVCPNPVCEELGLGNLVNCRKQKKDGDNECDCNELISFAITVRAGKIIVPSGIVCRHSEICTFSYDCDGTKEERKENFPCDLESLKSLISMEKKNKNLMTSQFQLVLFE